MTVSDRPQGSFPRRNAATRQFSLGVPRSFTVADDGSRVVFLRSRAGDDPVNCLWVFDVAASREWLVFDPRTMRDGGRDLDAAERAHRERTREQAAGIVAFATDRACDLAAFALASRLFVAELWEEGAREIPTEGPVFDPRPDPTGRRVAYVSGNALRVIDLETDEDRQLVGEDESDVLWGVAEFIAEEEMDRHRGYWWSPDGSSIAAARVDNRPVDLWYVCDPVDPSAPPVPIRYPAAGTANAAVTLSILVLGGDRVDVRWDLVEFPYMERVNWTDRGLLVQVRSRDQKRVRVLVADTATGTTRVLREDSDSCFVELVTGVPGYLEDGRLVTALDADDTRRIAFEGVAVTPPGLQVRSILHIGDSVLFAGAFDPRDIHLWRIGADGSLTQLTEQPGVHDAVVGGGVLAILSAGMGDVTAEIRRADGRVAQVASVAERPSIEPRPTFFLAGARELRAAVLTPGGVPPERMLPVLLDPYGGPHDARVMHVRRRFLVSQWFADQGFAVLVADGRGTPGRGTAWERAIYKDLAGPVLEDQVDSLYDAAERFGFLDLSRVAIRGWSFGGYLAALAVLRRPDVFHAAVVGAPVTDWHLYDTCYTERYLGHPDEDAEVYRVNSLLEDAPNLVRPLLLLHGMTDDNVVVANTLRLSRALLEAGRPHTMIPLSGVTHMTPQEEVAENLLLLQLEFLQRALGLEVGPGI